MRSTKRTEQIERLTLLRHTVGYLEDTHREFEELLERLTLAFEETGEIQPDVIEMALQKRGESSLSSACRFLEMFKAKAHHHDDSDRVLSRKAGGLS